MYTFNNEDLIEGLKKGDEKAFMFLVDSYGNRLIAYARGLVDDPAMAKDIVQNVFLKTWRHRHKLDSKFQIKGFLYKSVYNEFLNQYQKDKTQMILQYKYIETFNHIVEKTEEKNIQQMIDIVYREIEKLPPKCREIFNLSKKEGLTNTEISLHLGISVKTVEAQITRAFFILRSNLGKQFESILILIFGKLSKVPFP